MAQAGRHGRCASRAAPQGRVTSLLARLDLLIAGSTAPSTTDADLHRIVSGYAAQVSPLMQSNAERQAMPPVQVAVQRAADRYLTPRFRADTAPRWWAGSLWRYLKRHFPEFGLNACPCIGTVRAALKEWTPPNGDARSTGYAARTGLPRSEMK